MQVQQLQHASTATASTLGCLQQGYLSTVITDGRLDKQRAQNPHKLSFIFHKFLYIFYFFISFLFFQYFAVLQVVAACSGIPLFPMLTILSEFTWDKKLIKNY